MQPAFDMRIRTMIKAMTELVLPAIATENHAAVEQAKLVTASLALLMEQFDYSHWFEVADIRSHAQLANDLAALADLPAAAAAQQAADRATALADRWDVRLSDVREEGRLLRDAVCALVEGLMALDDLDVQKRTTGLVLEQSNGQIMRERSFVAKTNFDVYPDTLLPLADAMETQVQAA
jgi:hypothetical protein